MHKFCSSISPVAHYSWPCCFVGRQQQDTLGQQGPTVFGQRTAPQQSSGPVFGSGHQPPGTLQTGQTPFGRPNNTSSAFGNSTSGAAGASFGSQQQQQPGSFSNTGTERDLSLLLRSMLSVIHATLIPLSCADRSGGSTLQTLLSIALRPSCSTVLIINARVHCRLCFSRSVCCCWWAIPEAYASRGDLKRWL